MQIFCARCEPGGFATPHSRADSHFDIRTSSPAHVRQPTFGNRHSNRGVVIPRWAGPRWQGKTGTRNPGVVIPAGAITTGGSGQWAKVKTGRAARVTRRQRPLGAFRGSPCPFPSPMGLNAPPEAHRDTVASVRVEPVPIALRKDKTPSRPRKTITRRPRWRHLHNSHLPPSRRRTVNPRRPRRLPPAANGEGKEYANPSNHGDHESPSAGRRHG